MFFSRFDHGWWVCLWSEKSEVVCECALVFWRETKWFVGVGSVDFCVVKSDDSVLLFLFGMFFVGNCEECL